MQIYLHKSIYAVVFKQRTTVVFSQQKYTKIGSKTPKIGSKFPEKRLTSGPKSGIIVT
jgi:hypothetical protein